MSDDRSEMEMTDDSAVQAELAARLREARTYLGLVQGDVSNALGIPRASISEIESGKRKVTSLELRRFARLYRRSVGWLLGEEEVDLSSHAPLFRATEALSAGDKEQVLRFAEFLAGAGEPGGSAESEDGS